MNPWRAAFPIFRNHPDWIYLDSAATTHKPKSVIDAISDFYAHDYATVHRAAYRASLRATEQYCRARETVRRFLHAPTAEEIIFTRGTTESINIVARSLPLEPGDEILISQLEHHSNLVPWQMLAQRSGATLRWMSVQENGALAVPPAFGPRTKIVAITHMSNVTGSIPPITEITKAAHAVGAVVIVDGAQAAPHIPIDVQALDADFYAFSGHKCYGPTGVGVLYGKQRLLQKMLPLEGGGAMVEEVHWDKSSYQNPPSRFEAGTPAIAPVIGLHAALKFIEGLDRDVTAAWEQRLLLQAIQGLSQLPGLQLIGTSAPKGPILTFAVHGVHPLDIATLLDTKNISVRTGHLCTQPLLRKMYGESAVRASFAIYNTEEEIEQFVRAVEIAVKSCK